MRCPRFFAAALLASILVPACAREGEPRPSAAASAAPPAARASAPAATPASSAPPAHVPPPGATRPSARPVAPEGYFLAMVEEVAPTLAGNMVLLAEEKGERLLPIFVGGTEALSIELRQQKKRFERPLTHDLLDAALASLGAEIVKVHVEALRGRTFVGRVYLRQGDDVRDLDARPSDAIALALGNGAPIFVARAVLEASGVKRRDLEKGGRGSPLEPPLELRPPEPLAL